MGSDTDGEAALGDPYSYRSARALLEDVRAAVLDADRISRTIERYESREGVRAQGYGPRPGGRRADAMRATDARIDYESRVRQRREDDYALIDVGSALAYGGDQRGSGGVGALLGPTYADVVWWRFCAGSTWDRVSREVGMSKRWCQEAADAAIDEIDHYGIWRMLAGVGRAEG